MSKETIDSRFAFSICVVCTLLAGFGMYDVHKNARGMQEQYNQAVTECERTLPRNQHCDAKWEAFVKPQVTTYPAEKGMKTIERGDG